MKYACTGPRQQPKRHSIAVADSGCNWASDQLGMNQVLQRQSDTATAGHRMSLACGDCDFEDIGGCALNPRCIDTFNFVGVCRSHDDRGVDVGGLGYERGVHHRRCSHARRTVNVVTDYRIS